jgi:hypothetical protein
MCPSHPVEGVPAPPRVSRNMRQNPTAAAIENDQRQ